MTRGFVTIATGSIKYYKMAYNLCFSYRTNNESKIPFAIICDRRNKYTDFFDKVIVIKNPYKSVYDKFHLLNNCCFDEMVFIESDCLVFGGINYFFDFFNLMNDRTFFSALGDVMPLTSKKGWFTKEGAGEFANHINFCLSFHGGILFIRKNKNLGPFLELCHHILNNSSSYTFYKNNVCDESVFSLAMAVFGCKPINPVPQKILTVHEELYKFNFKSFKAFKYGSLIIHYGNVFTMSPSYIGSLKMIVCTNKCKEYRPSFLLYFLFWVRFRVFLYIRYIRYRNKSKGRKTKNG